MGFIRREHNYIVNGEGKPFLLKGIGLGSWLLPEGYMWQFPKEGDRPWRIEGMVSRLLGEDLAKIFWDTYRHNYINEKDIKAIAEAGFNSIRLPFNSRNLLSNPDASGVNSKELGHIDRIIAACKAYKVYVILDMHGAPGGQTGANIDDSPKDLPELFMSPDYEKQAIWLWCFLADRYKDEEIIAGYDLLNEPIPDFHGSHNHKLIPFYEKLIDAIRKIDQNHMIILEGLHWATDISVFTKVLDENSLLQFHKYWNENDLASIQKFIDKRTELNLPIFMGEGGENDNTWYRDAFSLLESQNISWNFWTYKKMDKSNSPYSVKKPEGWDKLCHYLEGGPAPSREEAQEILFAYLENLKLENCDYYEEVMAAVLRN